MKRILVTGSNSYIGTSLIRWLSRNNNAYKVDTISLRENSWETQSFDSYDVVVHTVGIAHVDSNPNPKHKELYFKINRDLAIAVAKKARDEGVKQFIFLSSIIVYGNSNNINKEKFIDRNTVPKPSNFYGESKLQAEERLSELMTKDFHVVVLRLPMIYGVNSKGNYPKLSRAAKVLPLFPDINNKRSMLHIDNLTEFIKLMIDNKERGLFHPQNAEYVKTSDMVKAIAASQNKRIKLVKIFNPIIFKLGSKNNLIIKVFGDLYYDQEISNYKEEYRIRGFNDSIFHTEK